jgi:hypothetical protein
MNGFMFFSRENRDQLKKQHPSWKIDQISKSLGSTWNGMSEAAKKKYELLSAKDKKRYEVEKYKFERTHGPIVSKRKRASIDEEARATSATGKRGGKFRKNETGKRVCSSGCEATPKTPTAKSKALFAKKREAMKLPEGATDADTELIMGLDGGIIGAALHSALAPTGQRDKEFGDEQDAKLADILLKKKANKESPYISGLPSRMARASDWLSKPENAYKALQFARKYDTAKGTSIEDRLKLSLSQYIPVVFPDTAAMDSIVRALKRVYGAEYAQKKKRAAELKKREEADFNIEAGLVGRNSAGLIPTQSGDRFEVYTAPKDIADALVGKAYGYKPIRDLKKAKKDGQVTRLGFL